MTVRCTLTHTIHPNNNNNNNSVALVSDRTIPTEPPPAKLMVTFADKGVSRGQRYFFFQAAPQLWSRGWADPTQFILQYGDICRNPATVRSFQHPLFWSRDAFTFQSWVLFLKWNHRPLSLRRQTIAFYSWVQLICNGSQLEISLALSNVNRSLYHRSCGWCQYRRLLNGQLWRNSSRAELSWCYHQRLVCLSVLVSCTPLGPMTRFFVFLSLAGQLRCSSSWGGLSDERTGLQFVVQFVSGQSRGGLITIYYCLIWDY
jgi:hypothetical protein